MPSFTFTTSIAIGECAARINQLVPSQHYLPSRHKLDRYPPRIDFTSVEAIRLTADESVFQIDYRSTAAKWRSEFIPIWHLGSFRIDLRKVVEGTQIGCQWPAPNAGFPKLIPVELGTWIILLGVLATFIYRAAQEINFENILAVVIFACVPVFYLLIKVSLRRRAFPAIERIILKSLRS